MIPFCLRILLACLIWLIPVIWSQSNSPMTIPGCRLFKDCFYKISEFSDSVTLNALNLVSRMTRNECIKTRQKRETEALIEVVTFALRGMISNDSLNDGNTGETFKKTHYDLSIIVLKNQPSSVLWNAIYEEITYKIINERKNSKKAEIIYSGIQGILQLKGYVSQWTMCYTF